MTEAKRSEAPATPQAGAEDARKAALLGGSKSLLSDELKEKLKKQHGEIIAVESSIGPLVFRSPTEPIFAMFTASVAKDQGNAHDAMVVYCLNCSVYPERDVVYDAFQKQPGLPATISNQLNEMAGAGEKVRIEKL